MDKTTVGGGAAVGWGATVACGAGVASDFCWELSISDCSRVPVLTVGKPGMVGGKSF